MPTQKATEERDHRKRLILRKEAIEEALESASIAEKRKLRIEIAELEEEILISNRRLRELMPRHKVSSQRELKAQADSYRNWLDKELVEQAEDGEDDHSIMQTVSSRATCLLTDRQREYLQKRANVRFAVRVAEELGIEKSSVSRGLRRANATLKNAAIPAFVLRKAVLRDGKIDLTDEEQLRAFLSLLTPLQRVYMSLYYGEWLSIREVAALLDVDQSSVSRSIRRGLGRLSICFDESVQVDGMEHLEEMLVTYYSAVDPNKLPQQSREPSHDMPSGESKEKRLHKSGSRLKEKALPILGLHREYSDKRAYLQLYTSGGCLKEWLDEKKRETEALGRRWGEAIMQALQNAFKAILDTIKGEKIC